MIMVGPGTGVAPFRGFLQERALLEHSGKNWLFFGERHQKTDFFYEEFWTHLTSQNKLILDTAFSRDQSHKMYVQHKIVEKGDQIWNWICEGAHIYICGEADPMAKEVEAALISVIQQHGKQPLEEAKQMLKKLRSEKRYLTDVY
jgi:sulfite reductase (NADPH) flavoprotein alpha-component